MASLGPEERFSETWAAKASVPPEARRVTVPAASAPLAVLPATTSWPPFRARPVMVPPCRSPRSRVDDSAGVPDEMSKFRRIAWPFSTLAVIMELPSTTMPLTESCSVVPKLWVKAACGAPLASVVKASM
jgi:hypothetical protein